MKVLKTSILVLTVILLLTSCSTGFLGYFTKKTMNGDRNVLGRTYEMTSGSAYTIVIKDITIENFDGMLIFDDTLPDSLVITTDENIFMSFDVTVDEDSKIITVQGDPGQKYIPTAFEITTGGLADNIDISGGFKIDMKFNEVKNPNINIAGAVSGNIFVDNADSLAFNVSGATSLSLDGIADTFNANISGAADINGYELKTNTADLNVAGASSIKLTVNEELYVEMSGATYVYYKGNAQVMKSDISGFGEIIKED